MEREHEEGLWKFRDYGMFFRFGSNFIECLEGVQVPLGNLGFLEAVYTSFWFEAVCT